MSYEPVSYTHLDVYKRQLQERAAQAWEILKEARSSGLPMDQAQELISELVYPPLESDDN